MDRPNVSPIMNNGIPPVNLYIHRYLRKDLKTNIRRTLNPTVPGALIYVLNIRMQETQLVFRSIVQPAERIGPFSDWFLHGWFEGCQKRVFSSSKLRLLTHKFSKFQKEADFLCLEIIQKDRNTSEQGSMKCRQFAFTNGEIRVERSDMSLEGS